MSTLNTYQVKDCNGESVAVQADILVAEDGQVWFKENGLTVAYFPEPMSVRLIRHGPADDKSLPKVQPFAIVPCNFKGETP